MKTRRLNKRAAKEAFRASRLARPEKQPRSAAKKAIKHAKAALKQSGGNMPRLRDLRAMQVVKDHSPANVARSSKARARAGKDARRTSRPEAKKARNTHESGALPRVRIPKPRSSDKQPSARPDSGTLKIALTGVDARLSAALLQQLAAQAAPRGVEQVSRGESSSDIAVQSVALTDISQHRARLHIYLEPLATAAGGDDHPGAASLQIADALADEHAFVVRTSALILRYNQEQLLVPDGLSDAGASLLASIVLRIATDRDLLPASVRKAPIQADDFLAAKKLAENPLELLSKLAWDSEAPPKIVSSRISREAIEAFVEGRLHLPKREEAVLIGDGIDWSLGLDDKKQKHLLYGLTFLAPVLTYWYAKANGGESEEIAVVDQYLKDAGSTASSLLARAGAVLADFASKCQAPEAWEKTSAVSRAKVQLLFVLCCRSAAKRRIRFEAQQCTSVFSSLLETLECLRSPGLVPVASQEGLEHLSFVIGLALPLRRLPYGKSLLEECCDALVRLQLEPGLTEDGVWCGSTFEQHCEALRTLLGLASATRGVKIPTAANLALAVGQMASFVESMLRAGNLPPPIDHVALVDQGKLVGSARKLAPSDSGNKVAFTTHAYTRAGYFVSHSTADHGLRSSQLAIHASAGSQQHRLLGRIGLGFCVGESELIIGGGVSSRKALAAARAASRTDLATGNDYRVNGKSYSAADSAAPGAIEIEHHCEGRGWAAVMIACRAHTNSFIRRTAIHLKPVHAFIMADQLESMDGSELAFEQFWHLSPDLHQEGTLVFAGNAGHFSAGFSAPEQFPVAVEKGSEQNPIGWALNKAQEASPNLYLQRTLRLARGIAVSAFQWSAGAAPVEVSAASLADDGWSAQVAGAGFNVRFAREGLIVRRLDREA